MSGDEEMGKLDRLCATEIMGWNEKPIGNTGLFWWDESSIETSKWQPTRNIAQAFEVLEKTRTYIATQSAAGEQYILEVIYANDGVLNGDPTMPWTCQGQYYFDKDEPLISFAEEAETAPLAIVKACLSVAGVEC